MLNLAAVTLLWFAPVSKVGFIRLLTATLAQLCHDTPTELSNARTPHTLSGQEQVLTIGRLKMR